MRRNIIAGAALVAVLALAPTSSYAGGAPAPPLAAPSAVSHAQWVPWVLGGCVLDIFAAAAVAHWRDNRELTHQEAYTCGLLFWFERPAPERRH